MVTVLRKGKPISELRKKIEQLKSLKSKGFKSSKYSGILKRKIDPLKVQKELRDEWQ